LRTVIAGSPLEWLGEPIQHAMQCPVGPVC
jgi:hypothetical protein